MAKRTRGPISIYHPKKKAKIEDLKGQEASDMMNCMMIKDVAMLIFSHLNEYYKVLFPRCCKFWHGIYWESRPKSKKVLLEGGRTLETYVPSDSKTIIKHCQQQAAREGDLVTLRFMLERMKIPLVEGCFEHAIIGGDSDVYYYLIHFNDEPPSFHFSDFCKAGKHCTLEQFDRYFHTVSETWLSEICNQTKRDSGHQFGTRYASFDEFLRLWSGVSVTNRDNLWGGALWQGNEKLFNAIDKKTNWKIYESCAAFITPKSLSILKTIIYDWKDEYRFNVSKQTFLNAATNNAIYTNDVEFCKNLRQIYTDNNFEFKVKGYVVEECFTRCAMSILEWIEKDCHFDFVQQTDSFRYTLTALWDPNVKLRPHPLEIASSGKTPTKLKQEALLWLGRKGLAYKWEFRDILLSFGCAETLVIAAKEGLVDFVNFDLWSCKSKLPHFYPLVAPIIDNKLYDKKDATDIISFLRINDKLHLLIAHEKLEDVEPLLFPGCWGMFAKMGRADLLKWMFKIGYPFPNSFKNAAARFQNPQVKQVFKQYVTN